MLRLAYVHASSEAHVLSSSGCSRPSAPALFIPLGVSFAQIVALLFKACSLSQPIKISLNFTCTHPPRLLFFYKPPFGFRFCSAREQPDATLSNHRRPQLGHASSAHQANEHQPGLCAEVSTEKAFCFKSPAFSFQVFPPATASSRSSSVQTTKRNLNVLPSRGGRGAARRFEAKVSQKSAIESLCLCGKCCNN